MKSQDLMRIILTYDYKQYHVLLRFICNKFKIFVTIDKGINTVIKDLSQDKLLP